MVRRLAGALIVLVLLSVSSEVLAQEQCRGTKKYYAGKCRYPKDIEAMKKKAAASKAAEQRRREVEARRRAAEEARKKAEAKEKDAAACELARTADTVAAWKKYLKEHSGGACLDEAINRITALSGKPPEPQPTPPPVEPQPDPEPVGPAPEPTPNPTPVPQPPPDDGGGGVHPLVWIGFGLGGVGLIVGAITGGISFGQASTLQDECDNSVCPASRQDDVDEMLALAHTSTVMFVVAGIGTGLGIVGIVLSGGDEETGAVDLRIGPGSLSVTGSF